MWSYGRRAQKEFTDGSMNVRVGIYTAGEPVISHSTDHLCIENALMGVGFHWQRAYRLMLPPDAVVASSEGKHTSVPSEEPTVIATLPAEAYLRSVVSSEMNPAAPLEFLKAHAIIARSWLLRQIERSAGDRPDYTAGTDDKRVIRIYDASAHSGFDVCNDDHCQRYQGEEAVTERAAEVVRLTEGLVLTDAEGRTADCRYSKCCGGTTELFSTCWQDTDYPYLISQADPWCEPLHQDDALEAVLKDYDRQTTSRDYYRWKRYVSAEGIASRLKEFTRRDIGDVKSITPLEAGPSGRVKLLRISGTAGDIEVGKELLIRRLLATDCLLSSAFTVERAGDGRDGFILHGRGWGHGVGLCQIGAASMAIAGHSAEDILAFYYPGTHIATIPE